MAIALLCLKIFFARIADVSLGTIRTIFTVKGKTFIAGLLAFFEVLIWFLVAKEALTAADNSIYIIVSYCLGFSAGTMIGITISKKVINSIVSIEVITTKATKENIKLIRDEGFGISVVNTTENYSGNNDNNILFITLNSKNLEKLKSIIYKIDPKAFIVVNESKIVQNGFVK